MKRKVLLSSLSLAALALAGSAMACEYMDRESSAELKVAPMASVAPAKPLVSKQAARPTANKPAAVADEKLQVAVPLTSASLKAPTPKD